MYHRIKNTLAGLAMVATFLVAGTLLSEPLPAQGEPQTVAPSLIEAQADPDVVAAMTLVRTALQIAERQTALVAQRSEAAQRVINGGTPSRGGRGARLKRELGMPYYSFGAMLPRHGES